MLIYPNFNPVALHIGPLSIYWYGLMYLVAFLGGWGILRWRLSLSLRPAFTALQLSDIIFYVAVGVIIGGRLGYMLFYDFYDAVHHPLRIFAVWRGGMSFHGGLLGVIAALWIYAHKIGKSFFEVGDFVAPAVPIGLAAGRIGNFINGELWGRVTDLPWGMVFPNADDLPRHPSQLYEFFLEGVVLFIILWIFSSKRRPCGAVSGLFLILYGLFRMYIEFFREPDQSVGYLGWGWLTEGQLLSFPMVIVGIGFMIWAHYQDKKCSNI